MLCVVGDSGHHAIRARSLTAVDVEAAGMELLLADEAGESFGVVDQELEDVEQREFERRGHGDAFRVDVCRRRSTAHERSAPARPIRATH